MQSYDALFEQELDKIMPHVASKVQNYAREHHNYTSRTGNLEQGTESSYDEHINEISTYIDWYVTYGKYIVEGANGRAPDPFIEEALTANQNEIDLAIGMASDRAWNRYCMER